MTPPLGLITVAALCPPTWNIRLIDHAFDELRDEDVLWADLVMVSAMHAQRADTLAVLAQARSLGRRTFIGGPWASSEPDLLSLEADHVLAGEVEEVFPAIAAALEQGTARSLYRISDKPDMTRSPVPRFDLLQLNKYTSMPVRSAPIEQVHVDACPVFARVSVSVRVLRHYHHLWAAAKNQNIRTDDRGARQATRTRLAERGIHCR